MTDAELRKHLDAAEKSPKEIAAAVSGLSEQILRYKPSPDKWCVLEILGHLADVEIVYGYRLRQMLADTKPVIAPLDQDAWARNLNYLDSPPSELVEFYDLGRHHNLRLLRNLKASDLSLWLQPLGPPGSKPVPPHQWTHFSANDVKGFAISPDGKQIVLSRGNLTSDIVLITHMP
jgi:hypothetical protein